MLETTILNGLLKFTPSSENRKSKENPLPSSAGQGLMVLACEDDFLAEALLALSPVDPGLLHATGHPCPETVPQTEV